MIEPPIGRVLAKTQSRFGLVVLASRRARQINAYFNQLGEGLGSYVPPQVHSLSSVSRCRLLSKRSTATRSLSTKTPRASAVLAGRHVVLAVSGGVAAYKAAYLARRLLEAGAEVRTIMTQASQHFLGAQTMAAITGIPPVVDLFGGDDVSPHTSLARWADVIVVAPATAATMARLARRAIERRSLGNRPRRNLPGGRGTGDAHRNVGPPGDCTQRRHACG